MRRALLILAAALAMCAATVSSAAVAVADTGPNGPAGCCVQQS
jgi:hypothetical protein